MDNTWNNMPESEQGQKNESETASPAPETAETTSSEPQNNGLSNAPQNSGNIAGDVYSTTPTVDEPQNPQPERRDFGSYSSYEAAPRTQQPYGGYTQQQAPDYMNPYGTAQQQQQQNYAPNASQSYGYNAQQQYRQQYQQPYQYSPIPQQSVQGNQNVQPPKKKKSAGKIVFAILLSAAIIAACIGIGFSMNGSGNKKPMAPTTTVAEDETQTNNNSGAHGGESINLTPTPAGDKSAPSADGKLSPEEVYEKLSKSNVGIVLYSENGNNIIGQGSGIIMSESGYILTCAHVIDNNAKAKIRVVLADNTEYDAAIVGYDSRTDIGVIKISPNGALNVAEFGDSNALKVGEQVIAIGNPGGLQFFGSFSDGKVSAIDRPVNSSIGYTMKCIQHTAAISPGNSGGMLVNMYGQVIGINSSKIANTDYEGIGFAIPISSAKPIIDDLIEHGYVTDRAKLGITYSRINANYSYYMTAYNYGMPTGSLVIEGISDDSDIKNYDVQQYDFITAVNGKELQNGSELTDTIEKAKPGDEIQLTISRVSNNAIKTFNITCKLVQDKGSATVQPEEPDESEDYQQGNNPFGGSGNPFGNGGNPFGDDDDFFSGFPF